MPGSLNPLYLFQAIFIRVKSDSSMPVSSAIPIFAVFPIETASFESLCLIFLKSTGRIIVRNQFRKMPRVRAPAPNRLSMPWRRRFCPSSKVATAAPDKRRNRLRHRDSPGKFIRLNLRRSSWVLPDFSASPPYFHNRNQGQSAHKIGYMVLLPLYICFSIFCLPFIFNLSFQARQSAISLASTECSPFYSCLAALPCRNTPSAAASSSKNNAKLPAIILPAHRRNRPLPSRRSTVADIHIAIAPPSPVTASRQARRSTPFLRHTAP